MRRLLVVAGLAAVVLLLLAGGQAGAQQSDDFTVERSNTTVTVGGSGDLTLELRNERSSDLENAVVTVESGSSELTFGRGNSATRYVGGWNGDATKTLTFDVSASQQAGTEDLPVYVTVRYETSDGRQRESPRLVTSVSPGPRQSASVSLTSDLRVGEKGTLTAQVTNDGPRTLRDATLALQPNGQTVTPVEPSQPLGTLRPGQSTTVTYPVRVAKSAEPGTRQLTFAVDYRGDDDQRRQVAPVTARASVAPAQSFALSNVSGDLRVDAERTLTATVTNDGPANVSDAVVVLRASDRNIHLGTTEYALGDLAANESATISVPVEVSEAAAAGPRQLTATVEYTDRSGEQQSSDRLSARVEVGQQRSVFAVEPVNNTVEAGSTATVTLRVTNTGDEPLRDLDAKAFVDAPLTAVNDKAFVPSLDPGESTTVAFDLRAAGDAPGRTRALELDFQYTEPDGDTRLSDTYKVPVELRPGESGGFPFLLVGGAAVVLLGLGGFAARRFR